MDTALVIAGTSFVGRHLVAGLRTRGIEVVATSRTPRPHHVVCDLHDTASVDNLMSIERPRWVFACAGATGSQSSDELERLHVAATATLLGAVRRHVPEAIIVLFGSAAEYGPVERLPIDESVPASPTTPYGRSKWRQTQRAQQIARDHGSRVHIVRPFNLLGPGLGPHYFAANLCQRLRKSAPGPVPITNGQATRDWLDVRDAADAVTRLAVDAPPTPGQCGLFNLATGIETRVLTLADHLCRRLGDFHAVDAGPGDSRSAIDRSAGDSTRLRQATGWKPCFTWQQSLDDLIAASVSGERSHGSDTGTGRRFP